MLKATLGALFFMTLLVQAAWALPKLQSSDKKIKTKSQMNMVLTKTTSKDLMELLREFVRSGKPNRFMGSPGHAEALSYLSSKIDAQDQLKSGFKHMLDFTPDTAFAHELYAKDLELYLQEAKTDPAQAKRKAAVTNFTKDAQALLKKLSKQKGHNLVWMKKGLVQPEEILVIGAHYDSINQDPETLKISPEKEAPGADDNATGVAILLELIAYFSQMDLGRTVIVAFLDYEELGLLGSRAFAQEQLKALVPNGKLLGFVNLLMVGYDTSVFDKEKTEGNMRMYTSKRPTPQEEALVRGLQEWGDGAAGRLNMKVMANGSNSGDQQSFWDANLPAVVLTQNWESDNNFSRHHTPQDFPETINQRTFHDVFRYVGAGAVNILNR